MKKRIERAILETLVVENKQSIHYAVDKISSIFQEHLKTSTKQFQEQLNVCVKDSLTAQHAIDVLRSKMTDEVAEELNCLMLEDKTINPNSWRLEIKIIKD